MTFGRYSLNGLALTGEFGIRKVPFGVEVVIVEVGVAMPEPGQLVDIYIDGERLTSRRVTCSL